MGFQRKINQPEEITGPFCIHLRSKGMYVREDFNTTDPYESGVSHYWCLVNQHVIGPDNTTVGRETCVPGRACYCDTVGQLPPKTYPKKEAHPEEEGVAVDEEEEVAGR